MFRTRHNSWTWFVVFIPIILIIRKFLQGVFKLNNFLVSYCLVHHVKICMFHN